MMEVCEAPILEVLEGINFAKIAKAMKAVGWTWQVGFEEPYFPNEVQLRQKALELFESVKGIKGSVSSGGFTATNDNGHLHLEFTLEAWCCQCYDDSEVGEPVA